jgi:hypothetical protein
VVDVNNDLLRLTESFFIDNIWEPLLSPLADFGTDGITFGLLGDNQTINAASGHGLTSTNSGADIPTVIFNMDIGEVKAYKPYWCEIINSTQFKIYTDYDLNNVVTLAYDASAKYICQTSSTIDSSIFYNGWRFRIGNPTPNKRDRFASAIYIVEAMFDSVGLTLDISGVATDTLGSLYYRPLSNYQSTDLNELWHCLYTLEHINQGTDSSITPSERITMWDFIAPFFGLTGITIECNGYKSYVLNRGLSETISYSDSDLWEYEENKVAAKYNGVNMSRQFMGTAFDTVDEGAGNISFPNNFMLLFEPTEESNDATVPNNTIYFSDYDSLGVRRFLMYYERALMESYTEKKYKVNRITTSSAAVENMVNISEREPVSEVIEEVY